jgi:hypothetical protein
MTLKNVLARLAVLPLAYVTVLGACNGIGVTEGFDAEPANKGPISEPGLPFVPNVEGGTIDFVQPVGQVEIRRLRDKRVSELDPRIDVRGGEPIPFEPLFVEAAPSWPVAPQPAVADAGSCEDAGTPPVCLQGELLCDWACVNPQSDDLNCGACGVVCGDAETCQHGSCTAGCEE